MRRIAVTIILGAVIVSPALVQASTIVYSQPALFPPSLPDGSATTSEVSIQFGGLFFQTFDNFVLAAPATISGLSWQGLYFDQNNAVTAPAPDATDWFITFSADNGSGLPGAVLAFEFHPNAAVNETFVSDALYTTTAGAPTMTSVFDYSLTLTTPFPAQAGTMYWLSIVPITPTNPPQWAWTAGSGGDGMSIQYSTVAASFSTRVPDRTFELTTVPEPASITLLAFGVAGITARIRYKRTRQRV